MNKTAILLVAIIAGFAALIASDDTELSIYDVDVNGTWASDVSSSDRFAKLVFENDSFTMTIKYDGQETVRHGYFVQEAKKLLLVVVEDNNHQSQMEVPYYVIDKNTIEVTLNNRTFMLERVS
jgi:hypothetical protein